MPLQILKIRNWLIEKWLTVIVSSILVWFAHGAYDTSLRIEAEIKHTGLTNTWVDNNKTALEILPGRVLALEKDTTLQLRAGINLCITDIADMRIGLLHYKIRI